MKWISFLLLACCAAFLAMAEPAHAQTSEYAETGVRTAVDLELGRAQKAWHEAAAEATRNHLRSVAARGDARSLLAVAMLWPQWQDDATQEARPAIAQERRAWFEAARSVRPRDPLVAWVEASDCGGLSDDCDGEGALQFLLEAEPDNAAVHILALGAAEQSGKQDQSEALWQAAALANNYDARILETSQLLYSAMSGASMPPLSPALAQSMGELLGTGREATPEDLQHVSTMAVWAAVAIPAYQTVTRGCRSDLRAPISSQRQAQCERIMAVMSQEESILISPMIGLRKMVELTRDRAEGSAWRERLRQFHWVYENAQRSMNSGKGAIPAAYLSWVLQEGELLAMRKLLQANGIAPVAPAGWLPERADIRALLTSSAAQG